MSVKQRLSSGLSNIVNSITGNDGTSEGQEIYDRSPLASTGEILKTERSAKSRYVSSLEGVSEQLHPGFAFDDLGFEVVKVGSGTQLFVSTHKRQIFDSGFIGVFRGDYGAYDDAVSKIPMDEFSENAVAKAFVDFTSNTLRLALPSSNSINEEAKKRGLDPTYVNSIVSDVITGTKLENKEGRTAIEKAEPYIVPTIKEEEYAKDSLIFEVIPYRKIKRIGPFRRNLVTYKLSISDASTGKKIKSKVNPFEFAKELNPEYNPKTEREAITAIVSHYHKENINGKYIVLADPDLKSALELGTALSKETSKSIPVELIVSRRPQHYSKVTNVEIKEKSMFGKVMKYSAVTAAGLGLLYYAAKGIKSSIPIKHNYGIMVNGEVVSSDSIVVNKDGDLEFLVDGNVVAKKHLKTKQEIKSKPKKKGGWFK